VGLISYIRNGYYFIKKSNSVGFAQDKLTRKTFKNDSEERMFVEDLYIEIGKEADNGDFLVFASLLSTTVGLTCFIVLMYLLIF